MDTGPHSVEMLDEVTHLPKNTEVIKGDAPGFTGKTGGRDLVRPIKGTEDSSIFLPAVGGPMPQFSCLFILEGKLKSLLLVLYLICSAAFTKFSEFYLRSLSY